jgi:hypothetical protein
MIVDLATIKETWSHNCNWFSGKQGFDRLGREMCVLGDIVYLPRGIAPEELLWLKE